MSRNAQKVLTQVEKAWLSIHSNLEIMSGASQVKPESVYEAFTVDPTSCADFVRLNVNPIIFLVPERAKRALSAAPNLYIVLEGWLSFQGPDFGDKPLKTRDFATRVGYFRRKPNLFEHVYGAHYDLDENAVGHPIFHAQMGPQLALLQHVGEFARGDSGHEDKIGNILRNVRMPTAQMDVFSVIAQICADHLINKNSTSDVLAAFGKIRADCLFFRGAAHRLAFLNSAEAANCYRSQHWYG